MKKLGAAIIGCGQVAEEYVKAFQKDDRSQVSRNRANAQRYRDRYDLQCTIETDASKMLGQDDVDIVAVCTPHNVHTEYVVAAAEAGKHVIIEKPVTSKIGRELGPVRLHSCGPSTGHLEAFSKITNLYSLDLGGDTSIRRVCEVFGKKMLISVTVVFWSRDIKANYERI